MKRKFLVFGVTLMLLTFAAGIVYAQSQISPSRQYFKDDVGGLLTLGSNGQYSISIVSGSESVYWTAKWEISGLTIRLYNEDGRLWRNCPFQWGQGKTISWVELDGIRLNRITN